MKEKKKRTEILTAQQFRFNEALEQFTRPLDSSVVFLMFIKK